MDKAAKKFWNRWTVADTLKKVDIVKELQLENVATDSHSIASLVNSFFVDLTDYLEERYKATQKKSNAKIILLQVLLVVVSTGIGYMLGLVIGVSWW